MVDYKKYIAVLDILNRSPETHDFDNESQAEDICELFDEKPKQVVNGPFSYGGTTTLEVKYPKELQPQGCDINAVPCTQCIGITV